MYFRCCSQIYVYKSVRVECAVPLQLPSWLRLADVSTLCSLLFSLPIRVAHSAFCFSAFTCIPAILNEYRTAELNVRTGCLKALSFVFEYVGPQSAYYCDSVVTMLEDALTDRDLVHRQTASTIVKHLALGVAGLGCED